VDVIKTIISDFKKLFHQVGEALFSRDLSTFSHILHSVKGNARLAGFQHLMKITHNLESMIQENPNQEWTLIYFHFDEIRREWEEIQSLAQILIDENQSKDELDITFDKKNYSIYEELLILKNSNQLNINSEEFKQFENKIKKDSFVRISSLESYLRKIVQKTAAASNKNVKLHFFCDQKILILEHHLFTLRTSLLHLLTNAVDHGIENSEVRATKKKPSFGNIKIDIYSIANRLIIQVEDDGVGLDLELIKSTALKKNITTPQELNSLEEEQIPQLIFRPGYTTAKIISHTSGRGVGLDSVKEQIEKLNGTISVNNSKAGGAFFQCIMKIEIINEM
jgi:two-component system chemotaxis sensor kinase CheA